MTTVFFVLTLLAVIGVVASLFAGFAVMAKGGETDKKWANKLMQARIVFQGAAVLFFVLALLTSQHS
jgi:cytochrome bd-type quinol oxidase subunit 2